MGQPRVIKRYANRKMYDTSRSCYVTLEEVAEMAPVQKAKLNDYTLVNLKLSQKVWDNRATLYIGVSNLFDVNYETSYGFPQAGRFIYGGAEFRL